MARIAGHAAVDSVIPPQMGRGYVPRDYASKPLGTLKLAKQAPIIKELTEAEILEAIDYKTAHKDWITNKCDRVGSKVKNQSKSNYCWGHAPTRGMECMYVFGGGSELTLAAFDPCAAIKNGRNDGGSGIDFVEWVVQHGICVESLHAPMNFSPRRTPEQEANAQLHKIVAYDDLDPGARRLLASYVIQDIPITVGVPVWWHEVLLTFLAREGNVWHFGIDNSWSTSYGDNGRAVLHGAYENFDEAGAIREVSPAQE